MARIVVVKAFVLNTVDAVKHEFAVGVHEVEQWIADHWYTQAHLATVDDVAKLKAEADALAAKAKDAADAAAALVAPVTAEVEDAVAKVNKGKGSAADVI